MAVPEDLERLRRSVAMLTPGQPAGLTREDAMALLAEVRSARVELERLILGLRTLLDEARTTSGPGSRVGEPGTGG
jgi:hypothetical protein